MTENTLRRTSLYESHVKHDGKIIEFAGWELPVYYEGIIQEHEAVRNNAGLFDVSHMGEIIVTGNDAEKFVNFIITNDAQALTENQIAYSLMCYPTGGIVDDVLVYKYNSTHFLIVVNAANISKDFSWIIEQKGSYNVEINNISNEISQIALQGPKSEVLLQKLTDFDLSSLKFFHFSDNVMINGHPSIVSRSGYTGEDGFEIYIKNEFSSDIFEKLLEIGKSEGVKPTGLGCRDTLRFEATLPLYGNEISADITPLEAGLGIFVKLNKADFIGKNALVSQKETGLKRKIIGFEMIEKAIPRHGYEVQSNGRNIGVVTTGYMSPTLKKNIGLALVENNNIELGTNIDIIVRNKPYKATITSKNFLNKNYKK